MTPESIWKEFSSAMANIVLSQRATKNNSDSQLQTIAELEEQRKKEGWGELGGCSAHSMSFIDPRDRERVFYDFRKLNATERMEQVLLKKNRDYQCLIMEAYERFEDAVESIYAFLGKSDINFWPLTEYGNTKYSEICKLDFDFYVKRAEKRSGGTISIVRKLFDDFKCDFDVESISLKQSIIFIEKLRHITVHRGGVVTDKNSFFKLVAKDCGRLNNGKIDNDFTRYMNFFFGDGKYENLINITEVRIQKDMPVLVEISRFEKLLDSMLLCIFILHQESKKYVENLVNPLVSTIS